MGFSNISFGSLLMIGFVAMIMFGPAKLKIIARDLGQALGEFKKGLDSTAEKLNTQEKSE